MPGISAEAHQAFLERMLIVARRLEALACRVTSRKRIDIVGYSLLVRNRRIAEAVNVLGAEWGYESRMLMRSMIELYINYAWMRLVRPHSRANRFLRFEVLERIQILEDLGGTMTPEEYRAVMRARRTERSALRYLFRRPDRKGRFRWDKHWALVPNFEGRLVQVLKAQGQSGDTGNFLYGLFRWTSSAVHGGPVSLGEVLDVKNGWPVPKPQPEKDPGGSMAAATVVLLVHVGVLANDLGVADELDPELTELQELVEGWTRPA